MRISHLVFIGLCAAMVSYIMLSPDSQSAIETEGHSVVLGQAFASLVFPTIFYGVYLLFTRKKPVTETNSSPMGGKQ